MDRLDVTEGEVTLHPDRGVSARWSAVGAAGTLLAIWVAVDARDSVLAWAFAALCLVLSAYVVVQLVRPDRFEVRLDPSGIEVHLPWQHTRFPWERIHLARIVTVTGEPVLELHVWDADDPAQTSPRATGVLLPLGADLNALHAQLDRRLGRTDPTPPGPSAGPEPH